MIPFTDGPRRGRITGVENTREAAGAFTRSGVGGKRRWLRKCDRRALVPQSALHLDCISVSCYPMALKMLPLGKSGYWVNGLSLYYFL